jgi:transposase
MPAPHPPELRRRAVEMATSGAMPLADIARDLHISESCLRNWLAQAKRAAGADAEADELVELRREIQHLRRENEVLRLVAAYFVRDTVSLKAEIEHGRNA